MDIQRKAFEESNNVNPGWSFKFDEELQQYVATDFEMTNQVDEFNEHWDTFRAGWDAKAQAVPERLAIKDVINERQRQVNQEFYSIENDDEYKENELVRAAACYTNNVVSRGWTYSESDLETYQSEEAPDFWPWDLDFWKPKSPRKDLVRAAALLIAEIERIDRAQEQKG